MKGEFSTRPAIKVPNDQAKKILGDAGFEMDDVLVRGSGKPGGDLTYGLLWDHSALRAQSVRNRLAKAWQQAGGQVDAAGNAIGQVDEAILQPFVKEALDEIAWWFNNGLKYRYGV